MASRGAVCKGTPAARLEQPEEAGNPIAQRTLSPQQKEIHAMANPIIPRSSFRVGNLSLGQCVALMAVIFVVVLAVYLVFSVL
jgi:hypothetical protein